MAAAALAHQERFDPVLDPVFRDPEAFYGRLAALAMTSRVDEVERLVRFEEILPGYPTRWYDRIVPLAAARDVSGARRLRSAVLGGSSTWNDPNLLDRVFFAARAAIDPLRRGLHESPDLQRGPPPLAWRTTPNRCPCPIAVSLPRQLSRSPGRG